MHTPAGAIAPVSPLASSQSLATGKKATASNVYAKMAQYGPEKAFDGNSETRWATDSGTKSAWLEVDLGKPGGVGRCLIEQAYPELHRMREFAIEYWQDRKWQTCYRGENLGATLEAAFPPVTAQRVRLNVTSQGYFTPTQYRFPLPRMNMLPPVNAAVATDSSPSLASATETNAFDARKTCIVPALSMA